MQICVVMTSPPSPLPPSSPRLLLSWPWSNTSSFTPRAPWASLVRAKEKSTCLQALLRMPASTGGRWRHGGTRLDKQTLAPLVSPAVPSLEMSSYSELNHTSSPIAETQERWPYAPTGLFTSLFKQTHFKKHTHLGHLRGRHRRFHTRGNVATVKVFEWAAQATEYTTHTCLLAQVHTHPPMGNSEWGVLRVWFAMANTPTVDPLKGQRCYSSSDRERSPLEKRSMILKKGQLIY